MAVAPLPREIIKWLQSLDLSFCVKNPKRDFSNGYLVAEILSRYYPKDISMNSFENGTRLAAKCDNWEQIYKVFKRKGLNIAKQEFDAVIHCAPGAAPAFIFHLYNVLTKRTVREFQPQETGAALPAFMRDTASKRLKDHEIARIQDNVERTIRAIDTLGYYQEERRVQKAAEAPLLIKQERRLKSGLQGTDLETSSKEELQDSVHIDEVRVKALSGSATQLRGKENKGEKQKTGMSGKHELLKAVTTPQTSVGALAGMQQPALFVKPAADIMRPLVLSIVQESEELSKMIDTRKDVVVSFMEQCREGVPDAPGRDFSRGDRTSALPLEHKMREIEETSVRVFETLANRAQLLVDTLTKSPPEFWKVWSTFFPALTDFSESSHIFESAVFLFKRLGDLMREADPPLTQQLVTEVGLPSLARELSRSPEKRECLCEILYSYTQEDTLNHLLVLRALKDKVGDNLPVYVSCLSCLISIDAQLSLLDEHLLDLYVYYALVAMQSPQPRIRVAGISILSTITTCSSQHHSIVALIPNFAALANDEWWEIQAQLLLLAAQLVSKLSLADRQDLPIGDEIEDHSASSKVPDPPSDEAAVSTEDAVISLLAVINRLFVVSSSKNVLQVGLSALVHLLPEYPDLLAMFVTVLLEQPPALRRRLLRPPEAEAGSDRAVGRLTYVMGNSSRMYEEKCVSSLWPHLDVAKTLARQLEASPLDRFELEHTEVMLASLPEQFEEEEADEWLAIFDKVKQYIFVALVDPELHLHSTQIIKRFWLCSIDRIATRSIEASKKNLLQALKFLYSSVERTRVDEAAVLKFLRDLHNQGGNIQLEVASVIESFQETHPEEYMASQLGTVLT